MNEYKLTEQDEKEINNLVKNNLAIHTLYEKLADIEKSESLDDFDKILDYLNISLEVEKKIYEEAKLNNNLDKCVAWIKYFLNMISKKSEIDLVIDNNKEEIAYIRICNYLRSISLKQFVSKLASSINQLTKSLDIKIDPADSPDLALGIGTIISEDLLKSSMVLIQKKIDSGVEKDNLIDYKYLLTFTNKTIENDMIEDKFQISKTIMSNSKFYADINGLNEETYNDNKVLDGVIYTSNNLVELLKITDEEINSSNTRIKAIILECFIRAGFIFMNDESLEKLNSNYHELIDDPDNKEYFDNRKEIQKIIRKCFLSIKTDKDILNTITFINK